MQRRASGSRPALVFLAGPGASASFLTHLKVCTTSISPHTSERTRKWCGSALPPTDTLGTTKAKRRDSSRKTSTNGGLAEDRLSPKPDAPHAVHERTGAEIRVGGGGGSECCFGLSPAALPGLPEEARAIARVQKGRPAQSAARKWARRWPKRPEGPLRNKRVQHEDDPRVGHQREGAILQRSADVIARARAGR